MKLITLAIKNLLRKRVRSIAIVCVGALAAGLIFSASAILQAAKSSLILGIDRLGADIIVVPSGYELGGQQVLLAGEPTAFYMDIKNIEKVAMVSGVEQASPQLFMTSGKLECCISPDVLLIGYDPRTDFTIQPWSRLSPTVRKETEHLDSVIIGGNLSYLSSEDIRYYGKQFRIGSLLYPTGLGFFDKTVFMTMDVARSMIERSKTKSKQPLEIEPDMISSILVKAGSGSDVQKVASDIEAAVPGVSAISTQGLAEVERRNITAALWGVIAAGLASWFMLLVLLALVFMLTINERGREIGILRAMGARKGHVFGLILLEATALTGTGAVIGIGLAWAVLINFKNLIIVWLGKMHFLWPSLPAFGAIAGACILLMLASGAGAALYPAIKASRKQPYDAIHRRI